MLLVVLVSSFSPPSLSARQPNHQPLFQLFKGHSGAENKIDSRGLLSLVFLFVCRSLCASKLFGKERTS
jgi:hypothetical protein